jgi:hypothetical protein
MIRTEAGTRHVLVYCTACPTWRRLADDKAAALSEGARHVALVHDQAKVAASLRERSSRITRHADTTGNDG